MGVVFAIGVVASLPQAASAQMDPSQLPYPLFAVPTLVGNISGGGTPTLLPYNPTAPATVISMPTEVANTFVSSATTATQRELVERLVDQRIGANDLVQADRDPSGVNTLLTYYIGPDARRHTFPSTSVMQSWYRMGAPRVHTITFAELEAIPLGANVTYRPGNTILRFESPDRYVVSAPQTLRRIASVKGADSVFGSDWQSHEIQLSDAFFADYRVSGEAAIDQHSDFDPAKAELAVNAPSEGMRR